MKDFCYLFLLLLLDSWLPDSVMGPNLQVHFKWFLYNEQKRQGVQLWAVLVTFPSSV